MNKSLFAIVLIPAFLAPPASALSLREAAQLALEHDPRMLATYSELDASAALKRQADAGWKPSIGIAGDIGRQDLQTDAPFPESGLRNPNNLSLSVSQPLYSGGATMAQTDAANSGLEAARQARDQASSIVLATVTAYLDVLRDRGVVELNQSSARTLEQAASDTDKRLQAGENTRTDLALAKARFAEAQAGLKRASAQLRISEAAFRRLTGIAPQALQPGWPAPKLPSTLDEALQSSAQVPAVQMARAQAESLQAQVRLAGADRLPRVSLDGRAATQDNTEFGYERLDSWLVQLKLSMPLYEGGLINARVSEARARADRAKLLANDAEQGFIENATQLWELLEAENGVIDAYQAQVEASTLALDGTRKELDAGTRTTLDLLDAERELLASQINLVGSQHDRSLASFRLIAACGRLEPGVIPE